MGCSWLYAGNSEYPTLPLLSDHTSSVAGVTGDNAIGADNQQERPGFEQWIVGFVDGEGCFSVPIFRNATTRLGWQAQPEFVVAQGERSVHMLHELRRYFECGQVKANRRYDNHRENMYRWSVRSVSDLHDVIVPFFELNPLRTAKAEEFEKFSTVVRMVRAGSHLTHAGMARIARIAETMNFRKPSRFLESSEAIRQPPRSGTEVKIWS
jgi:LAGLIDADG endonuclease